MTKGKQVPHFSLKPEPTTTLLFVLVLISGLLITLSLFWQEDGSGLYRHKGIFCAIVTGVLSFTLFLGATFRYWFTHLWKKNSPPLDIVDTPLFTPISKMHSLTTNPKNNRPNKSILSCISSAQRRSS